MPIPGKDYLLYLFCDAQTQFDVDAVNIEENSNRKPFSYVLPVGIQRQQALGVFNTLQNEQSLTMKIKGLCEREEKAVFKNVGLDMRVYDRINFSGKSFYRISICQRGKGW